MTDRCTRCGAVPADFDSPEIAPAVLCERCWDEAFGINRWVVAFGIALAGAAIAGVLRGVIL